MMSVNRRNTAPESWHRRIHGEPSLSHLLGDPVLHLMMRRDNVTAEALSAVIAMAQLRSAPHPYAKGH